MTSRYGASTVVDALSAMLGISMQEALNISVSVSAKKLDELGDIMLEAAIGKYDPRPMAESILEVEEEEEEQRYFAYVGDAVRVKKTGICGVVVAMHKERIKVALANGKEGWFDANATIELVSDDELYKDLERYKEQNQKAAAKAATSPEGIELPKKRKRFSIIECEAYDIATLRRPSYRTVKTVACRRPSSKTGKIHVKCVCPLPAWMFLDVPEVIQDWHAIPNKTRVGWGTAYIMGNGGYIVYPYTMMVLGDKRKSLWCAPEAFQVGDNWQNVATININRQDITTDILTSIALIWRESFNCPLPLKRTSAQYRSCKTCVFHIEGKEGGAMDRSDPMGGPAHWCMAGLAARPIDNRAVREGNLLLRTYPEGVDERSLIRFGDGWGTTGALRMRDVCGTSCIYHCFPGETQSRRIERTGKKQYVINVPGNPTEVWDSDDELMSYYSKRIRVVWHEG